MLSTAALILNMNNKMTVMVTWDRLKQQMSNKRTKPDAARKTKGSSAPHEIIVQRLASELDQFSHENLLIFHMKR